jgi:hypothetical protein
MLLPLLSLCKEREGREGERQGEGIEGVGTEGGRKEDQ